MMKQDRRDFLIKSGCALGMTALATQFRHFGMVSALAQKTADASPPDDYRALVCIFLLGGNDGSNTIVPLHNDANLSNYATYHGLRNPYGMAIAQSTLLPFQVPRLGNLTYGMHPSLGPGTFGNGLHELWAQNKLAIVSNVGTLAKPTTRTQMADFTHPKPYALYSHSDQTLQHHTGRSDLQI